MKTDLDQLQCVCNISLFTNCHFSKIASKSLPICLQSQSHRDCLETRYLAQSPWLTNVWGSYTRTLASDTEALIFPSRKAVVDFYSSVTEPLAILQQFSYQVILINGFISHGKTNRIKFTRVKTEPWEATFYFFFNKSFIMTLLLLNCFYLACISFATHRNKLH